MSSGSITAISAGLSSISSRVRVVNVFILARPITRPRFLSTPRIWFSISRLILTSSARLTSRALIAWLSRVLTRTSRNQPVCMIRAIPAASLRSLLLICIFNAALACRASMQMTGSPILSSSVHSHVDVGPLSSPMRMTLSVCDRTKSAIDSGSDGTIASCLIAPV